MLYICRCNDKVINKNQINYEPKITDRRQNRQSIEMGGVVCNHYRSIYNR